MGTACSRSNSQINSENNSKNENKILTPPLISSKAVKEKIPRPWKSLEDTTFLWKELQVEGTPFKVRYITPNMFYNLWAQSRNSHPLGNYGITFVDSQSFYYDVKVLEATTEEEEAMARLASKGALMKRTVIGALQPYRSFSKQSTTLYDNSKELAFRKINSTNHSDAILRYSKTINNWLLEQINYRVVVLFDHLWEGNASIRGDRVSHESQTFLNIMNCCSCRPEVIFILAGGFASLNPRYENCIEDSPLCSESSEMLLPSRYPCETVPLFPILTSFSIFTGDIGILSYNDWDKYKDRFSISYIINLTNDSEIFKFPTVSKIKYYSIPCYHTESPDYWSAVNIIRHAHHFRKSVLLIDSTGDFHSMNIVALFLVEIGYKPSEVTNFLMKRKLGLTFEGFMLNLLENVYNKSQIVPEKERPVRPIIHFPSNKLINTDCEIQVQDLIKQLLSYQDLDSEISAEDINECLKNLVILHKNVVSFPNNPFYRLVSLNNKIFKETIGKFEQGMKILELSGFNLIEKDGDKKFRLPIDVDLFKIKIILSCLEQEIAKSEIKSNRSNVI